LGVDYQLTINIEQSSLSSKDLREFGNFVSLERRGKTTQI